MKNPLLTELKKTLVAEQVAPIVEKPKIVIPKNPDDDLDDASLFAKATKGVQRLVIEETVTTKPNLRAKWDANTVARRAAAEGAADMAHEALSDTVALLNPVNNEAILSFRHPIQPAQDTEITFWNSIASSTMPVIMLNLKSGYAFKYST